MPTKYVFNYSKRGRLIYCNKYVATLNNDFAIAISDYEKQFIRSLKKDSLLFLTHDTIKMKDIKGFKKPGVTDATQVFPFVKHGTKIKIQ